MMDSPPLEITCDELQQRLAARQAVTLVDCREPAEHEIVHLAGAHLVPMGSVPSRLAEIQALPGPLVVYCHHGMRSAQTAQWLRENGVEDAQSLAGGIDAWAETIDPSLPRY